MKRRDLLATALDHLGIAHEQGLTTTDIDQFSKLTKAETKALYQKLCEKHDADDARLYLKFMKVEHEI
jgi:hypothetical protein